MLFVFALNIVGQVSRTPEVTAAQAATNKVLEDSGKYFREGMFALKEGRRTESGEKFDEAVEVFLYSTLNIQADQKLSNCYTNLIEAVYRIEFPSENRIPQLRELSVQCGWNWNAADMKLADDIAALVQQAVGFNSQELKQSVPDELLKPIYIEVSEPNKIRIVKARAGDTVEKLAAREKANPVEVAKYNGLLPNSVLGAGREIKIPTKTPVRLDIAPNDDTIKEQNRGPKPTVDRHGRVPVVMKFFNEFLHDPYSLRIVRWSAVSESYAYDGAAWKVIVRFRAKNVFGAYVLSERAFYIRNNKIVDTYVIG